MKKFILTFIFCGSLLLPVADLYAHGDPGTVLFTLSLRKALEAVTKKFEIIHRTNYEKHSGRLKWCHSIYLNDRQFVTYKLFSLDIWV